MRKRAQGGNLDTLRIYATPTNQGGGLGLDGLQYLWGGLRGDRT